MQHIYEIRARALSVSLLNGQCGRLSEVSLSLSCDLYDIAAVKDEFVYQVIEVVEDRAMLSGREKYWYDTLQPTLNTARPSRSSSIPIK